MAFVENEGDEGFWYMATYAAIHIAGALMMVGAISGILWYVARLIHS